MHPSHLKKEYIFKQRDDLVKQLIIYMTPNPKDKIEVTDNIRALALDAAATLM